MDVKRNALEPKYKPSIFQQILSQKSEPVPLIPKYSEPLKYFNQDPTLVLAQSESDTLEYRLLTLDNGLECMIACDPQLSCMPESDEEEVKAADDDDDDEEDSSDDKDDDEEEEDDGEESGEKKKSRKAACSMAVGVGSFEDPPNCQGLAHFLEHMVFMGTKKYPGENDWEGYISKRGGEDNAFTDAENTTYYFSIRPQYLEESLDRFAQFFISPLFAENTADREIRAIENEFQGVVQDEECRRSAVLCHTCSKATPLWKFGWGNLKSLNHDVETRQKLMREFHKKHYYARNMKLFVFGSDLDSIEKWVRTSFSDIPADPEITVEKKPLMCYINPLEPGFKKYYHISAVTDSFEITLNWHLPTRFGDWKSKPWKFVQGLVGHEGEGSLLAYLRKECLATELSAGTIPDQGDIWNSLGILFTITISVTEKGNENKELVIQKCFEYFEMLRNSTDNFERSWKEQQYLAGVRFHKMDRKDPIDKAMEIATYMLQHKGEKKYLLAAPHIEFEYNHELCCEILQFFNAGEVRLDILKKDTKGNVKEPWFGVDYRMEHIPKEVFQKWANAKNNGTFYMPAPNPFIPKNFDIQTGNSESECNIAVVLDDDMGRIFHKLDDQFKTPKTHMTMYIEHCDACTSVQALVALDIYSELFEFLMEEQMYPVYIAGVKYDYVMGLYGLFVSLKGYSEHMDGVFCYILEQYFNLQGMTENLFEINRKLHLRQLRNKDFDVCDHDMSLRDLHLTHFDFHVEDRIKFAEQMNFEQFQEIIKNVHRNVYLRGLIHGNCTRENASNLMKNIRQVLQERQSFSGSLTNYRLIKVPSNCISVIERKVVNPEETNSFVSVRFQVGPSIPENHAFLELLNHIAYEPYFDQLRTKEQLGYSVWSSFESTHGIMIFSYNVQSSTHDPKHVRGRIELFIFDTFLKIMDEMSEEDFKRQIDSLISEKQAPRNNLREVTNALYWEIKSHSYIWNRREVDIQFLEKMTKEKFMESYRRFVVDDGSDKRQLLTCIYGKDHDIPQRNPEELLTKRVAKNYLNASEIFKNEVVIDDMRIWKSCCETWPQFDRKFVVVDANVI